MSIQILSNHTAATSDMLLAQNPSTTNDNETENRWGNTRKPAISRNDIISNRERRKSFDRRTQRVVAGATQLVTRQTTPNSGRHCESASRQHDSAAWQRELPRTWDGHGCGCWRAANWITASTPRREHTVHRLTSRTRAVFIFTGRSFSVA